MADNSVTKICCIKECENPVHSQSMCAKHISRFKRHGDPLYRNDFKPIRAKGYTLEERFYSKVDKDGPIMAHMQTQCWLWRQGKSKRYGLFSFQGRVDGAHRWSYRMANEMVEIPDGYVICHECDNPKCVRPEHLFLGTYAENSQDMWQKGRAKATPLPILRGEDSYQAKLTADDVRTIRKLREQRVKLAELAEAYNITVSQVMRLTSKKESLRAWKHVD